MVAPPCGMWVPGPALTMLRLSARSVPREEGRLRVCTRSPPDDAARHGRGW